MVEKKQKDIDGALGELISISEAARIREVSHTAIQDLIKRGKLTAIIVGGRRLLTRGEVESFQPESVGRPPKAKAESSKAGKKRGGK